MIEYIFENGKIYMLVNGNKILIDKVGIVYDKRTGTLLKHGKADVIEAYYSVYISALSVISKKMAEDVVMVIFDGLTPESLVEFMNTSISSTGDMNKRISSFLQKAE